MTLIEWFADKPIGAKKEMAEGLGISAVYLSQLIHGHAKPSAEMAIKICKYTKGVVNRKHLRPDIFGV